MQINVNAPEGNVFAIIGMARAMLRGWGDRRGADDLSSKALEAETYRDVCLLVHKATGGAITFWDDDVQLEFEEGE